MKRYRVTLRRYPRELLVAIPQGRGVEDKGGIELPEGLALRGAHWYTSDDEDWVELLCVENLDR